MGDLNSIKIWHDNSGRTPSESSWYLRHVIIHDLQTRENFFFICDKWFALDKEDGLIERSLMLSSDYDKTRLNYLLKKQMKNNLRDNHLWLSIFARPVQSSFTRLDRLTCCFVLLALSMLINILYYGVQSNDSSSTSSNRLNIGTYVTLTPEQIGTGLMSSLFIFVPSFLLVELFKRIKRRTTRLDNIKSMLNIKTKKSENSNKEMKFPWWFKSFAYLISLLISGISLFFVVIKGIEFGEEKVAKWLTSLFVSFLSSLVLTQPLTVNPEVKFLNSIS